MSAEHADGKSAIVDQIITCLVNDQSPDNAARLTTFAGHFLRRVSESDLEQQGPEPWAALIGNTFQGISNRKPGQLRINVFNPDEQTHGWTTSHTVVEVYNDDMPFLVDSTTLSISEESLSIHQIVHPVFRVVRNAAGTLTALSTLAEDLGDGQPESVMHFQIDRLADEAARIALAEKIEGSLTDVLRAVRDWKPMLSKFDEARAELEGAVTPYDPEQIEETIEFLEWLEDNHFTLLGYREYRVDANQFLVIVPGSGLGILTEGELDSVHAPTSLLSPDATQIAATGPLIITKTNARSTVHRSGHMDYIGVMLFDSKGRVVGERRFLGLYTSSAYNRRPWNIPFMRRKVESVMSDSGFSYESHGGKALLHIMETLSRDELFQCSRQQLYDLVIDIYDLQERQSTRLFMRQDRFGRFFSCLVYIPRERYNTETREKVQGILKRALRGQQIDFTVQVSDSTLARLCVIVRVDPTQQVEYDVAEIERRLVEAVRSWHDKLREVLIDKHGEDLGNRWSCIFANSFPAAYVEDVTPWVAAFDVENAAKLKHENDLGMSLYRPRRRHVGLFRLKVFRYGSTIPLSDVLPMLENMGLRIVSERPYKLTLEDGSARWIQDFDMQLAWGGDLDLDRVRDDFQQAFHKVVSGDLENDGFNRLVLTAGLNWRQVSLLRAYCKYLLQTGLPFSQAYMESTLCNQPGICRLLVELFMASFDPDRDGRGGEQQKTHCRLLGAAMQSDLQLLDDSQMSEVVDRLVTACGSSRKAHVKACVRTLEMALERVNSLDEDRILRAFLGTLTATLRTNFFQTDDDDRPHPYISFKLASDQVPELPKPRPWREIFVYSPRVEGVHLRGGSVARGGLRWSDRREDFRTEVLGLMKAQMVKNTMIVPVGAKGGFVVKQSPEGGDRDAVMAEVVSCYRDFIHGLLDITDNLGEDQVVKPERVLRRDKDDPYLVVAADKGTASFSDIANSVSVEHGFWLGDAFASGGSVGYDHKKMGITAKGAWESVKRHFREMGVDCQAENFSVVGIGDMGGDVFGNGMLLSRHIQLKAAFNHIHIFLDPDPDPAASFIERERLFNLPRSAWTDYDPALISEGGGVFSRHDKQIPLSPQVREWLGIKSESLPPNELIRRLLMAPVDLLWNGGIGTYAKSSQETHADVGDRANDGLRVDGRELCCKIVGEGGNLGFTQLGRVEFALRGGRVNTDFIDNSAGVDCSDHEVNIKILLNQATAAGRLDSEQRNLLLAEMTEEVAALVLRNNYLQNLALSAMQSLTVARLGSKSHFIDVLEAAGVMDRELEFLPGAEELAERRSQDIGLARPELAVLLSYSKIMLNQELLKSDVPEDPYLSLELERYFPVSLRQRFGDLMAGHRLRREIISTAVTNSMVNRMGATFALRMHEDTGAKSAEIARAYTAAREILGVRDWWTAIEETDNRVPSEQQIKAQLMIWNLLRHVTRWILTHHRSHLDIAALVDRYQAGAQELITLVPRVATASMGKRIAQIQRQLERAGFDAEFSVEVAGVRALSPALDVIDVARQCDRPVAEVAAVYFQLDKTLKLSWLMEQIEILAVEGQWHAHARGGLRDELFRQHRTLTAKVMASGVTGKCAEMVKTWSRLQRHHLAYFEHMLADMRSSGTMDYATVSVAVRALEQLVGSVD
jgi:glutamate dehydrogenase